MIQPWPRIRSRTIGDYRIFRIRAEQRQSPRTGQDHEFFVIDSPNWVNVIAVTPARQLVMIEQYRCGTDTVELEIPGGMIESDDTSPVAAGVRELREETGYAGDSARILNRISPNPAIMSNTCFTVLVENCTVKHPVEFDRGEDLATRLVPFEEVSSLVERGLVRHSLVAVALYFFDRWRQSGQKS
jgi:ADP-ribose pyrophosphatase